VAGRFFLVQEYKAKGYFGFGMRVVSGTKRVAERLLWAPRRDAGVGVVQASLHPPSVVSQPHDGSICFGELPSGPLSSADLILWCALKVLGLYLERP
jgi:hypothetical protein